MEGVLGVDCIRRSRGSRAVENRSTTEELKFVDWIDEAYKDAIHFGSFQKLKVRATAEKKDSDEIGTEFYGFEARFQEEVRNKRVSTSWAYEFPHNPNEDEPIEEYVNGQLGHVGECLMSRLDAVIDVEGNVLTIFKRTE